MYTSFVPFRPSLEGIFLERFTQVANDLFSTFTTLPHSEREVKMQTIVRRETQWAVSDFTINPQQRRTYRAVWLLLSDLVNAGWQCRWRTGTLEIASPHVPFSASGDSAIQEVKDQIRQAMRPARLAKISEASTFIERMEQPQPGDEAQVSITALIAEGNKLAKQLEQILKAEKPERLELLQQVIQPYLQLVESGEYCKFTGHRLHDIWRYFRYLWSSPAEPTPGRTMLYLVRDAAQPYHPVIGIASLENAALQSPDRDAFFGWTVDAFQEKVDQAQTMAVQEHFEHLLHYIRQAINEIDYHDLCELQELEQPNADLLYRLRGIAEEAELERQIAVSDWQHEQNGEKSDLGNISQAAENALYLRKRAEALRKLLYAKIKIDELLQNPIFDWQTFLTSIEGQTAVRTALHAEKSRYVGTSILEVNVCGAIPPYNHLLGGKLVALLMLSPRVVADYRQRYGGRESDIASRMKGEAVVKPAELVYVGTTSLYRVGSSQYNRLKLPAEITESGEPLAWQYIGETRGHGTLHISRQTLLALEEIVQTDYVNHVFGEGASPKMRQIRHALNAIMSPGQSFISSVIIQHAMNRPIYGAWLATNGSAYLLGEETQPEYHFDTVRNLEQGTQRVIDYWVNRWLLNRLEYKPALDKVRSTHPTDLLISWELPLQQETIFEPILDPDEAKKMIKENDVQADNAQLRRDFIRNLYRGISTYADNMPHELLDLIHIETDLDKAILSELRSGRSVILTGNPGDGKTHLQRHLYENHKELFVDEKLQLILDASAIPNDKITERWKQANDNGLPVFYAINGAVLKQLSESGFPSAIQAQQQVENAIQYDGVVADDDAVELVVFDLSRRNVLNQIVVSEAIKKLTSAETLAPCNQCHGCDMMRNRTLLQTELFQQRLQIILNRISQRGYHATLRQLLAFLSFLLHGDRTCKQLQKTSEAREYALPQLIYKGKKGLFPQIIIGFDPLNISHPIFDERLIRGEITGWATEWQEENDAISLVDDDKFAHRKRQFFFGHHEGEILLTLADDTETEFEQFLQEAQENSRKAIRQIIRRINLFFGNKDNQKELPAWQNHQYDQSSRTMFYSFNKLQWHDFEILFPKLRKSMSIAFSMSTDHVVLRLKSHKSPSQIQPKLRIDYSLYSLLRNTEQGLPVRELESARSLWRFMEDLAQSPTLSEYDGIKINLLDALTNEYLILEVDAQNGMYLSITSEG